MIKNGTFGLYQGKEYKLSKDLEQHIWILTKDPEKIDASFVKMERGETYRKMVSAEDISETYQIRTVGKFLGYRVEVLREHANKYEVGTTDYSTAVQLKLDQSNGYYYQGEVMKRLLKLEYIKDMPMRNRRLAAR